MNNISKTIGWADKSWNPITGCLNECKYCYARRIYQRFGKSFKPRFHYDRLGEPLKLKKPTRIFVCSVSDFWGRGVQPIWRHEVYNIIKACPEHTFMVLSKQLLWYRFKEDIDCMPDNLYMGVTVTTRNDRWRIKTLQTHFKGKKFISCEPLLADNVFYSLHDEWLKGINWVIIGAMTGPGSYKYQPKPEWIENILKQADKINILVYMKDNLKPIWTEQMRKEIL